MLQPLCDHLWHAEHAFRIIGIPMRSRMTVVKLASGGLVLHSPIPLDGELRQQIGALGPVTAIIAPSGLHHLWAADATRDYPEARLYASPVLGAKRPDLRIDQALSDPAATPFRDELDHAMIAGMPGNDEVVFLHRPTRTLIVSDLVFNLGADLPLSTRLFTRMTGTYNRFAASRLFRTFIKDRGSFGRSLERVLGWDFDRLVMAHGRIVEAGGASMLRQAYA
jgi:hypothetical protein